MFALSVNAIQWTLLIVVTLGPVAVVERWPVYNDCIVHCRPYWDSVTLLL